MYENRLDAGEKLAAVLKKEDLAIDLILAIPRGGVQVAYPVARELRCPLKVVIPRKIGAPGHEEMAIGAVAWDGSVLLNQSIIDVLGIPQDYIDKTLSREREEISRRTKEFPYTPADEEIEGKNILLVDDGIATGYTVRATIAGLKKLEPRQIHLGVPVGVKETLDELAQQIDGVFCPLVPDVFWAVGQFYYDFTQVTETEVARMLQAINACSKPT